MHRLTAPGLVALSLALTACGGGAGAPPAGGASSGAENAGGMISLTLRAPFGTARAQGLPGGAGGAGPVKYLKVRVYDGDQKPVTFNGQNVYALGGPQGFLTLDPAQPSLKVALPRGQYSFENIGKTSGDGAFLAYGWNKGMDLAGQDVGVDLDLHTLLDPQALTLKAAAPVASVVSGDVLDLRLRVPSPADGGARYDVPPGDYDVEFGAAGGEVLSSSKLGVRARAGAAGTALSVRATVTGWRATGPESAAQATAEVTFEMPVGAVPPAPDQQAPTLTFDPATGAQQDQPVSLSGTASDDRGIASLKVYDGETLIGSTGAADGVGQVEFGVDAGGQPTNRWTLDWTPNLAGDHALTVVARDPSGNESRQTLTVAVAAPAPEPSGYDDLFVLNDENPPYLGRSPVIGANGEYWLKVDATALMGTGPTLAIDTLADVDSYFPATIADFTATYGTTRAGATLPMEVDGNAYLAQPAAPGIYWVHVVNKTNRTIQVGSNAYK